MSTLASLRVLHALPTELRLTLSSQIGAALPRQSRRNASTETQAEDTPIPTPSTSTRPPARDFQRRPGSFKPPSTFKLSQTHRFNDLLLNSPHSALETLTLELERVADIGRVQACLQLCKEIQKRLIFSGGSEIARPSLRVYKALLKVFGSNGLVDECGRTIEDMLAIGVRPDVGVYNAWLQAAVTSHASLLPILAAMQQDGIPYNASTYQQLVADHCIKRNIEASLLLLEQAEREKLKSTIETYEAIILLAVDLQQPKLAHDLVVAVQANSARQLAHPVLVRVLESCASEHYTHGLDDLYPRIADEYKFRPTVGLLMSILSNAARLGRPTLAFKALGHLRAKSTLAFTIQEYHMAPLVEALCRDGQLHKAIETISTMRANGVTPVQSTAIPISEAILLSYQPEPANEDDIAVSLDNAYEHINRLYTTDSKKVDITVLNALLSASVKCNDYHRALTTYKDLSEVEPDIHTYNTLLQGCINLRLRSLGDSLLTELKAKNLKPDMKTYECLIELCVVSQSGEWKDGLGYLKSLTSYGITPSLDVYVAIGARTGWEDDREGLHDLLEEVYEGYGRQGENVVRRSADTGAKDRAKEEAEIGDS